MVPGVPSDRVFLTSSNEGGMYSLSRLKRRCFARTCLSRSAYEVLTAEARRSNAAEASELGLAPSASMQELINSVASQGLSSLLQPDAGYSATGQGCENF